MKKIVLVIALFLMCKNMIGQMTRPDIHLPNVANLNKFIDCPVDKKTGVTGISIPVYVIQEDAFELPISLNYHTGGIKVEEVASNVGLGWALSAEATISRSVRGAPDESWSGWYTHGGAFTFTPPSCLYDFNPNPPYNPNPGVVINHMEEWKDNEPDLFYFTTGSYSGKFVFGEGKVIRLIPEQDIKIEVTNTAGNAFGFVITTPDGIKYTFSDTFYDYSQTFGTGGDATIIPTTWHAASVTTVSGKTILFEYAQDGGIANRKIQHESTITGGPWCPQIQNAEWRQTNRGYKISKIITDLCEVQFNYKSTFREDYRPDDQYNVYAIAKALDNVKVIGRLNGDIIKSLSLKTSYFTATENSVIANDDYLKKRLRLDEVVEYDAMNNALPAYKFSYNKYNPTPQNKLPNQVSTAQDHWGYYNGQASNTSLYPGFTFSNRIGTHSYTCNGANRNPVPACKNAFILDEIVYPTGGLTKFIYESTPSPFDPAQTAGGLRVKEKYVSAGSNAPEIKTTYIYENADIVGGPPVYYQYVNDLDACYNNIGQTTWPQCSDWQDTLIPYKVYTHPVNYTGEITSNHIIFGKVTEKIQNSGSIESYYDINSLSGEQDLGDAFDYPYVIRQPLLLSGKLIREVVNNEEGNMVKETEYVYGSTGRVATIGSYMVVTPFCAQSKRQYSISTGAAFLQQKTERLYQSADKILTTITDYEYGGMPDNHHQVTRETTTNSDNKSVIVRYRYPKDYPANGFITSLINRNIIGSPVEKLVTRAGKVISGELVTYWDNLKPKTIYNFESDGTVDFSSYVQSNIQPDGSLVKDIHYRPALSFNAYDNNNNPLEIQRPNGIPESFIWGYKSRYPVAKILNANNAGASGYINQTLLDNATGNGDDANIRAHLNNLRSIAGALVKTYTYKPLVGITSETDENGRTSYYEYDSFNRLSLIRDQDGKILKKICYNYAGKPESCIQPYYSNDAQQGIFYNQSCPAGTSSVPYTHTIPQGAFISFVSVADANQQAVNALNTEGQGAANLSPCLAGFSGWNKTTYAYTITVSNASYSTTYSFYPGSSSVLLGNIPVGIYTFNVTPLGGNPGNINVILNGVTYNGTGSLIVSGYSINSPTSLTLQAPPASGPCSYTMNTGFSSPTNSISNTGSSVSGYLVFYTGTAISPGYSYKVATINGGCKPSGTRTFSTSSGGRNWTVTVYSNGDMYVQLAYGSATLSPYSTASITISYAL